MSELFHAESGEWNQPGNLSNSAEVAKEPPKEQVLKERNDNMVFGVHATAPSAAAGGHEVPKRPEQNPPKVEQDGASTESKPSNPFV